MALYKLALGALLAFILLCGGAFAARSRPVLFQVFAETNCACGEFFEEVSGWTVFNPFRDQSPELAAAHFLDDLRSGKCTVNAQLCRYALEEHRVSEWHLENRHDRKGRVELYYRLTESGAPAKFRFNGQGRIDVSRNQGVWTVLAYSSYF